MCGHHLSIGTRHPDLMGPRAKMCRCRPQCPEAAPTPTDFVYDEMAYFAENCAEYGLELP